MHGLIAVKIFHDEAGFKREKKYTKRVKAEFDSLYGKEDTFYILSFGKVSVAKNMRSTWQ